ncbi:GDSL-like Lipase/Acylhydrolase [Thalassoglobus neptunius]|uniref:GDSL-like Lipase/Acylhydrolase n=1 Tax=Thalassoglobus neptunius TaxID=1938619 RepID=A0A5C5X4X9_9PLAN|nr:SGNH/GDSL hydrolase family protein [Thalassoglobus neptunius]TWT57960.1 GDSL-like Lipase/Acylhydrolase [Thalassoglobus neptunius]
MLRVYSFCVALGMLSPFILAQDIASPLDEIQVEEGDCIVFLGDSITHQCLYTQYVEDYFYTRFPKTRLVFHNAGVGGAKAWDALQRFDDDVAAYQPKYVTVLLGMNDGTYRPYDQDVFQTYRNDMTEVVDRIEALGATPILMTPTMFDARAARLNPRRKRDPDSVALYNSVLAYFGTWCREVATERGYGFVDMWSPLNNLTIDERETTPDFTLIQDAVHPGPAGQLVMAAAIINDLDLPRVVSTIRIAKNSDGKWSRRARGGKLTNLEASETSVKFTWLANSLPWVVPEDAAEGVELTRLGHRLSKESLELHGLEPGKYELLIDGETVGTFDSSALARHIELQANAKTPQYQQALEVAKLNKERNESAVRSLRNEWRNFQQLCRIRRQVELNPDAEDLKNQLTKLEKSNEGILDRVKEHRKAAKSFEDKIYEVNQPQERTYEIRKKD